MASSTNGATAAEPAAEAKPSSDARSMAKGSWSDLPASHNLSKFANGLSEILENTGYREMYGVELHAPTESQPAPHTTLIILQKFLRANTDDLPKAKAQLMESLKWRKEYEPLKAKDEVFSADKFGKLGYVTTVKGAKETKNAEDVATFGEPYLRLVVTRTMLTPKLCSKSLEGSFQHCLWVAIDVIYVLTLSIFPQNIYGAAAQDPKRTFGDIDAFIRWRVALMELTLSHLNLNSADQEIPDYGRGPDPYQAIQIHDYLSVSFFRQPAEVKASSSKIIDMFQRYYPETVSYKYFVNVPLVMQWMMGMMKALMSKDSVQRMTWMTYGSELKNYLGDGIPKEYGGSGPDLADSAATVKYE